MEINAYNVNSSTLATNSALSADKSSLGMNDFLNLLVAQMKNQDSLNPMDNTEFVSQLAQFSSLQAMSNLEEMSRQSQATSLIGKTIVVADYNKKGDIEVTEGVVEKVTIFGGETYLFVDGKAFDLANVMEIKADESANDFVETLVDILDKLTEDNSSKDEAEIVETNK